MESIVLRCWIQNATSNSQELALSMRRKLIKVSVNITNSDADIGDMTVSFYDGVITARRLRIFAPPDIKWKIDTIIEADTVICHIDIIMMLYWLFQSNYYVIYIKYVIVDGLKIAVEAWEDPVTGEQHLNTSLIGLLPTPVAQTPDPAADSVDTRKPFSESDAKSRKRSLSPIPDKPGKAPENSSSLSTYFSSTTVTLSEIWHGLRTEDLSGHFNKLSSVVSSTAANFVSGCAQIAKNGTILSFAKEAYVNAKQSFGKSLRTKLEQFYESLSGTEPAPEDDDARIYGRYIDIFNIEVQLRNALPVTLRELELKKGLGAAYLRLYLHEPHHRIEPKSKSSGALFFPFVSGSDRGRNRMRSDSHISKTASIGSAKGGGSVEDLTWVEVQSASSRKDRNSSVKSFEEAFSLSRAPSETDFSVEDDTWRMVASPRAVPLAASNSHHMETPIKAPPTYPDLMHSTDQAPTCVSDAIAAIRRDSLQYDLDPDAWNGIHSKILSYRFEKTLLREVLKGNAGRLVQDALFQWAGLPIGSAHDGDSGDSEVLVDANPIFFDPDTFSPQK